MHTFKQFIVEYPLRIYEKGEIILLKGDAPKTVYIIESGLVKAYSITRGGDERLVLISRKGEDVPIGFSFGLIEKSSYFYEAFSKCVIRMVPRDAYLKFLHANPDSMYMRHARMVAILLSTLSRVDALEQPRAGDKVAHTLLYMAEQFGVILQPYKSRFKLSITQQEIADSLGITRETTSIALKKLELKKIITHSRKNYVLYMERLRKYLEEEK